MVAFWVVLPFDLVEVTDVLEAPAASIVSVRISRSQSLLIALLHTCRHENLKSHSMTKFRLLW
jgi:hypothetical protein